MTDDIVIKLEQAATLLEGLHPDSTSAEIMREAADQIRILEDEIRYLKEVRDDLVARDRRATSVALGDDS